MKNKAGKIKIVCLMPEGWREYRNLRLLALTNAPDAFGSTFEEEISRSPESWRSDLESSEMKFLFAQEGKRFVGMTGYYRKPLTKLHHIVTIFGIYVDETFRGQGVGTQLLDELLLEAKQDHAIKKIKLKMVEDNVAALKLYEHHGFRKVGQLEQELGVADGFRDEVLLERVL